MRAEPLIERIDSLEILNRQVAALVALDPRLQPLRDMAGDVPLRRQEGGFAGLSHVVNGQLLSVASARAIDQRFVAVLGEVTASSFLALDETGFAGVGLSRAKYKTLRTIAEAELSGVLDYATLGELPVDQALRHLTAHKGIGPWTAEIYLLFCVGHPDIFPAGDLALQKMVGYVLGDTERPDEKRTRAIAGEWAPYRGAAARLLWRAFAVTKQKEGIAL